MRFKIKELGDSADVSSGEKDATKELVKLLFLATLSMALIYFSVSFASEYFIRNITIEQENKWFKKFDLSLIEMETNDLNSEQIEQVDKILSILIEHPSVPKLNYKIFVIQDEDINAFAFPGGNIGVTSGLLSALDVSDEVEENIALAFVIGHELGHFKYRHHLKGLSRTISVGLAFALLTGNSGDLSIINNVLTLFELNHSQKQETESDLFSAKLVFDTYASTKNIEKLFIVLKEKNNESESFSFLSTHPSSELRINKLLNYSSTLTNQNN
ncbi:MAG: hypothetical protein COA86_09180 [Kangiella sp.]|nr:MAG: hypothetical protein COA86_09180 [Kangiella sp.]